MDILEAYTELIAGTLILIISVFLLVDTVIDPALTEMEANYQATIDKALTYNTEQNPEGGYMVDGRISVFDRFTTANISVEDRGTSRMYFRPEQMVMMPAVDTDLTSSPNAANGTRTLAIAQDFYSTKLFNSPGRRGIAIGVDPLLYMFTYQVSKAVITDRQLINTGKRDTLAADLKALAATHYGSPNYGNQPENSLVKFGGFNITIDSGIHEVSGRPSNSVIFVRGRVPER